MINKNKYKYIYCCFQGSYLYHKLEKFERPARSCSYRCHAIMPSCHHASNALCAWFAPDIFGPEHWPLTTCPAVSILRTEVVILEPEVQEVFFTHVQRPVSVLQNVWGSWALTARECALSQYNDSMCYVITITRNSSRKHAMDSNRNSTRKHAMDSNRNSWKSARASTRAPKKDHGHLIWWTPVQSCLDSKTWCLKPKWLR